MTKRKRRAFTKLPCGLKLRLDMQTGNFDLHGDLGGMDYATSVLPRRVQLRIDSSSQNLMALSAFFLVRAREREQMNEEGQNA